MAMTVAMLLSCDSFESFFGRVLKLDREKYLRDYRNDFAWYYARGLIENGLRPVLYIASLNDSGLYHTDVGVDVRFLPLAGWYRRLAFLRRACRATRWTLYAQERLNAVAFERPLRDALAEDEARLFYIQEYWGGRFDHLAHRSPVPVSAADHGGLADGVVKWFKRSAMKKATVLYGQTPAECERITAYGGRAELHSNGCDTSVFRPDPSIERTKTVLTVARLTNKQKRTSDLIRAMTSLSADWTLEIVGTGPDQTMLSELATELGVADRVKFHGFQGRTEVLDFMRRCGVYAMPSANEAVCIAVLEAMGCGAAVVATRIRAFEPLIEDGVSGRLVPVGEPAALAAAIEDAWQRRDTMGRAAVDTVRTRYDAQTLYRRLARSMRASAGAAEQPQPTQPAGVAV
ncbi:MAG TPA: glycosyltransferase family 4 protein [Tepidisphaeraceae bacterium]|jgi:glycosyltransferase involved in cell wall biosynthesis